MAAGQATTKVGSATKPTTAGEQPAVTAELASATELPTAAGLAAAGERPPLT